ncbi:MAG: hypothetical protein AAF653_16420, partial [Chloroflexota bacterium]
VYRNFHVFQKANPEEFEVLISIFYSVLEVRKQASLHPKVKPLHFALHSDEDIELPVIQVKISSI